MATLSGYGVRLRLERGSAVTPGVLRLLCRDPDGVAAGRRELTAPNGVRIVLVDADLPVERPPTAHAFVVRRLKDKAPWVIGRAGMAYRDLIPGRLGGSIIASHIRIPDAGPVPDMVHYHTVGFQLIFCYSGWVRLVYEDQGPPFVLGAGDCVIQPPRIRHRVLEASENLQVIEIGVPAEHVTTVDHEMTLPTPSREPRPPVRRPGLLPQPGQPGAVDAVAAGRVRGAGDRHRRRDRRRGLGAGGPRDRRESRAGDQPLVRHPVHLRAGGVDDAHRRGPGRACARARGTPS